MCQQPTGFVDTAHPDAVCLLDKSLYGLWLAPRAWFNHFAEFVVKLGFRTNHSDSSLFVLHRRNDIAYLLIYVDDIVLTGSSPGLLQHVIDRLRAEFTVKDLSELRFFLDIDVKRTVDGFYPSQERYVEDILEHASMMTCKPVSTPVESKGKLSGDEATLDDASSYRSLVGTLMYLTVTRPDLAFAMQQACLQMHDPCVPHMTMLERILRYVHGTTSHRLHLHASPELDVMAYSDANWAGCLDTRHSTSGFCIFLDASLVSWSSKR